MAGSVHQVAAVLAGLFALTFGGSAHAADFTAGGGYDYQGGPNGETWSAPMGFATVTIPGADGTVSLARYNDSDLGWGWNGFANLGVLFSPHAGARGIVIRSIGDDTYRAWRVQVGPIFPLGEGRSLSIYGVHFEDNLDDRLNQFGGEVTIPISTRVSGHGGGAIGGWQDGASSTQAIAGATWNVWKRVQLTGQGAIGENMALPSSTGGGGIGGVGPIGPSGRVGRGHGMQSTSSSTGGGTETALLLGFRVSIP